MKKLLLSIVALSIAGSSFAQNRLTAPKRSVTVDGETKAINVEPRVAPVRPVKKNGLTPGVTTITVTDIGNSPNALTCGFGAKTAMFAHPAINSAVMIFRNDPSVTGQGSSGYYNYALSTDGGATWLSNQFPLYNATGGTAPPFANGRYPQALIYNPSGNTNPTNAYIAYAGAGLAATNGTWGGIPNGALQIGSSTPTQNEILSSTTQVPNMFMIAPNTGNAYVADIAVDAVTVLDYIDSIALYTGTWNGSDYTYAYTPVHLPVAVDNTGGKLINEARIAFAPNSNIGYITALAHMDFSLVADSNMSPIILKTTDGGVSWTNLGTLELDNIDQAFNLSNTFWTTGFEHDLIVDNNGNPHIVVAIGGSNNDFSILNTPDEWGIFDLYSTDGGATWNAQLLDKPQTFRFTWGATDNAIPEDSRPQVSTTLDGSKVFFTWFDTDTLLFGTPENSAPDAHGMAYDVASGLWTNEVNLTAGSDAEGACSFGNVSPYVFASSGVYTIPMSIQVMVDPAVALATTTHKYVDGMTFADADFTVTGTPIPLTLLTSVKEIKRDDSFVKSVYPNPASDVAHIDVTLKSTTDVTIELTNTLGQVAMTETFEKLNAGLTTLNLSTAELSKGVYIVKVIVGDSFAVSKLTIK